MLAILRRSFHLSPVHVSPITLTWGRCMSSLVTTSQLRAYLENRNNVKVVDGSWHLPMLKRDAKKEYAEKHIPTAVFFDIDAVSDKSTNLPHMLPSVSQFEEAVGALGICSDDHVVIYDSVGVSAGCRVWWTFKIFGHRKLSILDGGLSKWIRENGPVESGVVKPMPVTYRATFNSSRVRSYNDIITNISKSRDDPTFEQILDARPAQRFAGFASEPRAGIESGHMPNSISVPSTEVVNSQDGTLLDKERLKQLFRKRGVDLNKKIVTSCGSGVTASILYVALLEAGAKMENLSLYDGSWAEYASTSGSKILKGE